MNNNSGKIQKYCVWGLILIVAISIPGTGAWSGSLIAANKKVNCKTKLDFVKLN